MFTKKKKKIRTKVLVSESKKKERKIREKERKTNERRKNNHSVYAIKRFFAKDGTLKNVFGLMSLANPSNVNYKLSKRASISAISISAKRSVNENPQRSEF